MTREEAIHILNGLKPTNTKSSFDAYVVGKAIVMAIEALKQEPILDKIRAEIMMKDGLEEALEIIDKYKAESEDK